LPDLKLISAGLAMGLAIAAPLGPVNIIVMREVLARGAMAGVITGLGAIAADGFFAIVTAFGLKTIMRFFEDYAHPLGLIGGVVLVAMGIVTARSRINLAAITEVRPVSALRAALASFTTTITNPGALIGVFAVFAGMSPVLRLGDHPSRPMIAVLCFALGGLMWWFALSLMVSWLKHRLSENALNRINRWTGIIIAAFGFAVLMEVVW
jgi:threonine/homoserine/homoserine lactone efflux protein